MRAYTHKAFIRKGILLEFIYLMLYASSFVLSCVMLLNCPFVVSRHFLFSSRRFPLAIILSFVPLGSPKLWIEINFCSAITNHSFHPNRIFFIFNNVFDIFFFLQLDTSPKWILKLILHESLFILFNKW